MLRGFEEDVKVEDVFASTALTATEKMLLSHTTDLRSEGHSVFIADVKTAFHNAHMEDGDVVCVRPPPESQPETLDPSKGTVIWKLQKSLCVLRSAPRRWHDHLEDILRKCGFVSKVLDTCLWTHPSKRVSLVCSTSTICCWLERARLSQISFRLGAQEQRGEVETNALPGTNPGKNEGGA